MTIDIENIKELLQDNLLVTFDYLTDIEKTVMCQVVVDTFSENFFSDREARPHDESMYGEPEGGYDDENTESFDLNLVQCSEV